MSLTISNGQFQKYVKRADSEMKIAIAGTGAMGSVYAALLKDAGNEVWAVDTWQAHVEEINKNGLQSLKVYNVYSPERIIIQFSNTCECT